MTDGAFTYDGGLVDMHHDSGDFLCESETICTISNPFETECSTSKRRS